MHYCEDDVIYMITCTANGKKYIGRTSHTDTRFKNHLSKMRNHHHSVEDMNSDYDKFGEGSFEYSILCKTIHGEDTEYVIMNAFKSYDREVGYNYKDRRFR